MTSDISSWTPSKEDLLIVGPSRWTGTAIISDISTEGDRRLIEIGLAERLVLDKVDGVHSVDEIHNSLVADGVNFDERKILAILNKFAFYGAIKRPFAIDQGTRGVDALATLAPNTRLDQLTAAQSSRGILTLWRRFKWLANPAVLAVLAVVGIGSGVLLGFTFPNAVGTLADAAVVHLVIGVGVAILWSVLVTLVHENGHAALFNVHTGREPYLALTRFGIILMPNTHMPGFSLMDTRSKVATIVTGPLISMVFSAVPVALFLLTDNPAIHAITAVCIVVDAVVIALGIMFFPNTDATRVLETIAAVDQIQAVAFRTLSRRYTLLKALPVKTRIAIRVYPVLLLSAIAISLAVIVWAAWLILN